MEQGLFQQFPCDEIYGMHNAPNGKPGQFEICKGRAMAGAAFFDIVITGLGSHAAMPQQSQDPVMIAAALVGQIQSIISRNVVPLETCVLSVTQIQASSAYNVVPERANLAGTIRYFEDQVYDTAWIQTSSATVDLKAAISSAMASAGVLHPRVFLGRLFIRFATSFSHVWLAPFRSVPLGMN
jgi:metal-dependent amidase/aminoacylase/carboxypeptidase family protein